MCNSTPGIPLSLIDKLYMAADAIGQCLPGSDRVEVIDQVNEFRELLWRVIELAPDPTPYTLTWNLINLHARADLLAFEQGNNQALARIQEKIEKAIHLLP